LSELYENDNEHGDSEWDCFYARVQVIPMIKRSISHFCKAFKDGVPIHQHEDNCWFYVALEEPYDNYFPDTVERELDEWLKQYGWEFVHQRGMNGCDMCDNVRWDTPISEITISLLESIPL
jgi:hypothetical protein